MDEGQLRSVIQSYVDDSVAFTENEVSQQQADSLRYYYGEKPAAAPTKGRSSVVSRDVADGVDWVMPSLMRIFQGDKDVVRFKPQNAQDIQQAKQEQQYVNYIFNEENNGYMLTHDFLQDGLLAKNGVFKVYQEEKMFKSFDDYSGLTLDQLKLLLAPEENELIGRTDIETEDGTYFDVRIAKRGSSSSTKVCVVPAEELIVDNRATGVNDATFMAHRQLRTRSDLLAMGFDIDLVMSSQVADTTASYTKNQVYSARRSVDSTNYFTDDSHNNTMSEKIWVNECYIYLDFDGDGYAELRRVFTTEKGDILSNDLCDEMPFATASPFRMSHKFYGRSMYDVLKEVQDIKTALLRNLLDNMYNINNGRYEVVDGQVNLDDLMNNKLGGAVRVKQSGMIKPLSAPALPSHNFDMLSYFDQIRTDRSGVSERSKGLDSNVLHSNQAASSVWSQMGQAEQRIEFIARMFADGFKDMFKLLRNCVIRHQNAESIMEVNGKFVPVDPRSWSSSRNVIVSAGIGNNNKEQRMAYMGQLIQVTQSVINSGGKDILVNDSNIYTQLLEYTKLAGFDNAEEFWTDPNSEQSQQAKQAKAEAAQKPKPDEISAQAKMMEAQTNQFKAKTDAQLQAQRLQGEQHVNERAVAVKEAELPIKQEDNNIKREKNQIDLSAALAETMLEAKQNRNVEIGTE